MKQLGTDKNPFIFIVISMFFCPPLVAQSENPRDPQEHQHIAQGAAIFKKSCSVCHNLSGREVKTGPSLAAVLRPPSASSERRVRRIVADGKGTMPAFKDRLSAEEMSRLIEFLRNHR